MGMVKEDDGWRLPDEVWAQMEPLLPPRKPHPLGCHNPRVPDRSAMNAIFFVLRTGAQWNSLNGTGICSSTSSYRRFREWSEAGVFEEFWRLGLLALDALGGIDWSWLSMDGAMTKAPLGGEKNRSQSYGSRQRRRQTQCADGGQWDSSGGDHRRSQPARHETGPANIGRDGVGSPSADDGGTTRTVHGQRVRL